MKTARVFRTSAAALAVSEDALPAEFLIFPAGKIETTEGADLFDAEAARSVLAFYAQEGVDMMIDREHDYFNEAARAHRNDAADAMGWFNVELRKDGSLWAVNVRWTDEGATRLRKKTQRYTSAAFTRDKETGRILRLLNVAITSMPATHDAVPLVAASRGVPSASRARAIRKIEREIALAKRRRLARIQTSCQRKT